MTTIAFFIGVVIGMVLTAFMIGSKSDNSDPEDTERLDFLTANKMSLDCSPEGETWAVLDGFPRDTKAMGRTGRHAIDKAREAVQP